MEKNINDIEFRKLVLGLNNDGLSVKEISETLETSNRLIKDVVATFHVIDVNAELNNGPYTPEELLLINSNMKIKSVARELNRSYCTIKDKRNRDRKTKKKQEKRENAISGYCKSFSQNEYGFIKISYEGGIPTSCIAKMLNRTEESIRSFCKRHKIKKNKNKGDFVYGEKY